jgi:hypothetical protein
VEAELGIISSPLRRDLMAIYAGPTPAWVDLPQLTRRFAPESRILRSLGTTRYQLVDVVEGLAVRTPESPSIRRDMLRPGAVIPPGTTGTREP